MGFGDLKTKSGQDALNSFLADRSYIEGYEPTQADAVIFSALTGAPPSSLPHALRWWNHINSYGSEKAKFTGEKKDIAAYGQASGDAGSKADPDDDFDLFGDDDDDEDDEEAEALRKQRAAEYVAKKAKKTALIAKSNIILEVKPWDDETDMKKVEELVRTVATDGLLWGASKLVPVGYGINKLQITCVVEDDKVGTDFLEESITAFEDFVQSVDIVAFNKI
ncbi:elongation factor 1-beta-like [Gigantopelta aegis]|uniref:elongation factor 1-beta-like n=1 Tax=Gigantopelta aegis TaxID=1735272 RepID=UPI001B88E4CD|nr:elongation factor 1-beta-like [Gigantopelta aegis]